MSTTDSTTQPEEQLDLLRPVRVTRTSLFAAPADDTALDEGRASGQVPRRHEVPTTPDAAAYKQAGNAVCVGAVQVAFSMLPGVHAAPAVLTAPPDRQGAPALLPPPPR